MSTALAVAGETSTRVPGGDIVVAWWAWAAFVGAIVAFLLFDLLVLHRHAHAISMREAAITSAVWVVLGLAFTLVLWAAIDGNAAVQYLTGYVIEKSLSVDNVFVWAVILGYFAVPAEYQHRVLFWGIFGALVMRAIFIFAGIALLNTFGWMLYVFGAFLLFTAWRVARHKHEEIHPEHNPVLKLMRRTVRITADYHGQRFWVREHAKLFATPLLVVLVLIEITDVVFAADSIPAILAVTRSEFIVFAANAFAILGLRALYFLFARAVRKLRYLNIGLGIILAFVGVKMLLADVYHPPTVASLGFITAVLAVTIGFSLRADAHERQAEETA